MGSSRPLESLPDGGAHDPGDVLTGDDDALPLQLLAEQAVELVPTVGQGRTGAGRGGLGLAGGYGRMLTLSAPVRLRPSPVAPHPLHLLSAALADWGHLRPQ